MTRHDMTSMIRRSGTQRSTNTEVMIVRSATTTMTSAAMSCTSTGTDDCANTSWMYSW